MPPAVGSSPTPPTIFMITTDQLFKEPFEPQWMARKRAYVEQGMRHSLQTIANYKFMIEARDSRERISERCDARGRYKHTK